MLCPDARACRAGPPLDGMEPSDTRGECQVPSYIKRVQVRIGKYSAIFSSGRSRLASTPLYSARAGPGQVSVRKSGGSHGGAYEDNPVSHQATPHQRPPRYRTAAGHPQTLPLIHLP